MTGIAFVVRGTPAPQGSKRGIIHRSTGRVVLIESSKNVAPWREAVRSAAAAARREHSANIFDGPLYASMVFTIVRPRSHYRTGRNAHLLRDDAPIRPDTKPDVSKLARSTEDALTDAHFWLDDARVVEYTRLAKVWAREDPEALDTPGAVIRVWPAPVITPQLALEVPA